MADYTIPSFLIPQDGAQIHMTIPQTQAQLTPSITYNEAGITYNEAGVQYGGLYLQNQDVVPAFSESVLTITPTISAALDVYTQQPASGGKNGPGFFMFVNLS